MTVKELRERLKWVNPDAEVQVIAQNYPQKFTLVHGGADGCSENNCLNFGFYVDSLNTSERGGGQEER